MLIKIIRIKFDFLCLLEGFFRRILLIMDLIFLGVGIVIGIGVYIIILKFVRDIVVFVVILFVIVIFLFFLLFGICYVEFSLRILKCGLVYVYCYVVFGEIWVFIVGWIMILEYVIVIVVLVRICSEYIDYIFGGRVY